MRLQRFRSMRAYAILLVALGILTSTKLLLITAVLPIAFMVQGAIGWAPNLGDRIETKRTISPENPYPGQPVEVDISITNTGKTPIPDVRFADGVPEELGVTSGATRGGGVLRSGASLSQKYTLVADRGVYEFGELSIRARNISGSRVTNESTEPKGDGSFECRVTVDDVPLPNETTPRVGQLATDSGGPGIEFYATRKYRPGDPVNRIDWRQYAKRGVLSTIEYREQRAAHVVTVTDSRPTAHVAAEATQPTGATLSAYAATRAIEVLISEGHTVSVGALGIENPHRNTGPPAWVAPDDRGSFQARVAEVCNEAATEIITSNEGTQLKADGGDRTSRIRSLTPAGAQVMIFSPLTDEYIVNLVEVLRADGHTVTVLSPDITPENVEGRVTSLQRSARLNQLRRLGASVVDWSQDEELPIALSRALEMEVGL